MERPRQPVRKTHLWRGCLVFLGLLGGATAAQGQERSTIGLNVGGGVALGVLAAAKNYGWGPEASLRVGYGFGQVQLFARGRYSVQETDFSLGGDSWRLWSTDAGVRLHLVGAPRGWAPYLEVAGALRSGTVEAFGPGVNPVRRDWDLDGAAVVLGAGALIFLRDDLSVDVGVNHTRGWLENPRDDDPWVIYTGALVTGVSWWP